MRRVRSSALVVGLLLCTLSIGDAQPVSPPRAEVETAELQLVRGGCNGFSVRDWMQGRASRSAATCRPVGIDGGVVRMPIAKATKRDRHNFNRRAHGSRRHTGTDFRARCGTRVRAAHAGKVMVLDGPRRARSVAVTTGPQRLTTWYGPLAKLRVRTGAVVGSGRVLGSVSRGRRDKRCDLHFAVRLRVGARDPDLVNPSRWLRRHVGTHVGGLSPGERRRGAFIAATFNVLGHTHTDRGGKKARTFPPSTRRMQLAISLLDSNRVSLVGLQEFQGVQRKMFLRRTKGWKVFSPRQDPQDSIAWRTSRFRLLRASSFEIPYFKGWRPMPVVTLRDRATGRKLSVISVHNPANKGSARKMAKRRAIAVGRELRMVKQLQRKTRAPVILMGDFNDNDRGFFCRITKHGLHASSRGQRGKGCRPSRGNGVDWIFGTRKIKFRGHLALRGGLVDRTTDHPLVIARVRR